MVLPVRVEEGRIDREPVEPAIREVSSLEIKIQGREAETEIPLLYEKGTVTYLEA